MTVTSSAQRTNLRVATETGRPPRSNFWIVVAVGLLGVALVLVFVPGFDAVAPAFAVLGALLFVGERRSRSRRTVTR